MGSRASLGTRGATLRTLQLEDKMDKTITREEYEEIWGQVEETLNARSPNPPEQDVTDLVNNMLVILGIDIPDKPILPGVTEGEWELVTEVPTNKSTWAIWANGVRFAWGYENSTTSANGKVMAGSKKLTKDVVAYFRYALMNYPTCSDEARAVIDQVEEMGVDVSEFK